MKVFFALLFAIAASASPAQLTFTKNFPGSKPEYESIAISRDGSFEYKEAPDDQQPVRARLSDSDTAALFDLAAKLNYFRAPLESGLKVANTGKKTFRYTDEGGHTSEAVFNYSLDPNAQLLWDKFEAVGESERAYLELDRTVHFDQLGVNDALAQIESLWLRKELAAPAQFIPLLNRIASHEAFMTLARERAARLRDAFQTTPAATKS